MPIYEYNCKKCGVFEVTQRITEAPLKKCPTCKRAVERIISATSFVLKGSGWYQTDYANKGSSNSSSNKSSSSESNNGASAASTGSTASTSEKSSSSSSGEKSTSSAEKSTSGTEKSSSSSDKAA